MINLREFWQAAMANLRAIFSARPAPPPPRPPLRALPGPVASDDWTAHPPRQLTAETRQLEDTSTVVDTPGVDEHADTAAEEVSTVVGDEAAPAPVEDGAAMPTPAARGPAPDQEPVAATTEPAAAVEDGADSQSSTVLAMLESLLFVASEPTSPADLARALELTPDETNTALAQLVELYQRQGRGLRLQSFNGKVQLVTAPVAAPYIERFLNLDSTARLSGPALETLAVVAYRQPVTRAQIESVRGVDCAGVLRSLLQRGLINEVGRVDAPGRPILYGVTEHFMQHFGLSALDDLPPLEEEDADRLWAATILAEEDDEDGNPVDERD